MPNLSRAFWIVAALWNLGSFATVAVKDDNMHIRSNSLLRKEEENERNEPPEGALALTEAQDEKTKVDTKIDERRHAEKIKQEAENLKTEVVKFLAEERAKLQEYSNKAKADLQEKSAKAVAEGTSRAIAQEKAKLHEESSRAKAALAEGTSKLTQVENEVKASRNEVARVKQREEWAVKAMQALEEKARKAEQETKDLKVYIEKAQLFAQRVKNAGRPPPAGEPTTGEPDEGNPVKRADWEAASAKHEAELGPDVVNNSKNGTRKNGNTAHFNLMRANASEAAKTVCIIIGLTLLTAMSVFLCSKKLKEEGEGKVEEITPDEYADPEGLEGFLTKELGEDKFRKLEKDVNKLRAELDKGHCFLGRVLDLEGQETSTRTICRCCRMVCCHVIAASVKPAENPREESVGKPADQPADHPSEEKVLMRSEGGAEAERRVVTGRLTWQEPLQAKTILANDLGPDLTEEEAEQAEYWYIKKIGVSAAQVKTSYPDLATAYEALPKFPGLETFYVVEIVVVKVTDPSKGELLKKLHWPEGITFNTNDGTNKWAWEPKIINVEEATDEQLAKDALIYDSKNALFKEDSI